MPRARRLNAPLPKSNFLANANTMHHCTGQSVNCVLCAKSLIVSRTPVRPQQASMSKEPQCVQSLKVQRASMFQEPQCVKGLNVSNASMCKEPQCVKGLNMVNASMCQGPQHGKRLNVSRASMYHCRAPNLCRKILLTSLLFLQTKRF